MSKKQKDKKRKARVVAKANNKYAQYEKGKEGRIKRIEEHNQKAKTESHHTQEEVDDKIAMMKFGYLKKKRK